MSNTEPCLHMTCGEVNILIAERDRLRSEREELLELLQSAVDWSPYPEAPWAKQARAILSRLK